MSTGPSREFTEFDGALKLDAEDITKSDVSITLKFASLSTGVEALDKHMRSKDFFEVETFPEISFKSIGIQQSGKNSAQLTGDLTIKDVQTGDPECQSHSQGEHPPGTFIDYHKGKWLGFTASTTILRSGYNVGMFAPLTSDWIEISISTELSSK